MEITKSILSAIFGEANEFCGKEDVLHAIIYRQLILSGLSPLQIAREQPISSSRIDVVVFDKSIAGQFHKTSVLPRLAIEVKGGAYGDRNALNDEICSDGYCKDMEKLEKEVSNGLDSWFICVDMPELGRAVNEGLIRKIHKQCAKRKISFAYFCQGGNSYYYLPVSNQSESKEPLTTSHESTTPDIESIFSKSNAEFMSMSHNLLSINGHEANTTAAIYQLLRESGLSVPQVSLETYFSFAKKKNSRMHDRPDLVVFNQNFDGKFNLYQKRDRSLSNDLHKLSHINSIIEVKGSAAMNSKSDKARLDIYSDDIEKLKRWKLLARSRGCKHLKGMFFCLDGRKKGLSSEAIQHLFDISEKNLIVYISNSCVSISATN